MKNDGYYDMKDNGKKSFTWHNLRKDGACKEGMDWYNRMTWIAGWRSANEYDAYLAQDLAKNHPDWLAWAVYRGYACEGAWCLGRDEYKALRMKPWDVECCKFLSGWDDAILQREEKTSIKPVDYLEVTGSVESESPQDRVERLKKELKKAEEEAERAKWEKPHMTITAPGETVPRFWDLYFVNLGFKTKGQADYARRILDGMDFKP